MTDTAPTPDTKKVIVGIDGSSASDEALAWALRYAPATETRLELLRVIPTPWTAGFDAAWWEEHDEIESDVRKQAEELLASVVQRTGVSPGPVDIRVVIAQPPAAMLIEASETAELLVVGAHGGGGFHGMLLGSVSAACTHHARCPVVVVRHGRPEMS